MIVYTKHPCTKCDFTLRLLDNMGAKYEPREFDAEALMIAKEHGIQSAPMVVVGDVVWGDLRTDMIEKYAVR